MTVESSTLRPAPTSDDSPRFEPSASFRFPIERFAYAGEEWIVEGTEPGGRYVTTMLVRLPRDRARFSGSVVVEPLHFSGIAPISLYSSTFIMRSGHAWAMVAAQKSTIDEHVRPCNPTRYADLHIDGPDLRGRDRRPDARDPDAFWDDMARWNRAASPVLAQAGAAIADGGGPFEGLDVRRVILAGHSQTGSVVSRYLREAHAGERRRDGSPVYDGYFPSGFPFERIGAHGVPIIQVISDGDVSDPDGTFMRRSGRPYRREDADEPGDRFRLYELAGVPHMGTRYPPFDDVALWRGVHDGDPFSDASVMNTLPHNELFNVALHHLVEWVAHGVAPPRAPRIETAEDGWFVRDEHGNTRGGVRTVQMDVPRARYHPNVPNPDGTPSRSTVGTEEPFSSAKLRELYGDAATYRERFERRLAELVAEGWMLADDTDFMRDDQAKVRID
jgi:hypothetical protein